MGMRRVLVFYEWLGRLSVGGLKEYSCGIRGVRDIMVGEAYDYEP